MRGIASFRTILSAALRDARAKATAVVASFLIFCAGCDAGILAEKPETVGFFYRLEAHYVHVATGEPINFDFIVACNVRVTRWQSGGSSYDPSREPRGMFKPLPDGGAIFLRSFEICRPGDFDRMPKDPFPGIIVFDDVNDLSFGFGYATEDAYESPRARVKFIGATISASTDKAFQAWREKAASEYEQVGAIPGPWGYSPPQLKQGDKVPRDIGVFCYGFRRLKLPDEILNQMLEIWPADAGRYWIVGAPSAPGGKFDADSFTVFDELVKDKRIEWPDGLSYWSTRPIDNAAQGTIRRNGTGFLNWRNDRFIPAPHFPYLPRSRFSAEPVTTPQPTYPRRVLADDSWEGFTACGGTEPVDTPPLFDPEFGEKDYPVYINDERAYGRSSEPQYILDRTGHVYDWLVWGRAGI